jgi:hypothetical protein
VFAGDVHAAPCPAGFAGAGAEHEPLQTCVAFLVSVNAPGP